MVAEQKKRRKNIFSLMLIVVGILVSLYPLYTFFYANYEQKRLAAEIGVSENSTSETVGSKLGENTPLEDLTLEDPTLEDPVTGNSNPMQSSVTNPEPAPLAKELKRPDHGEAFIRLEIPKLDVSVIVISGTGQDILAKGVGWYEQSALPGLGNTAIAGHNNIYGAWFRNLHKLQKGDELYLVSGDTRYSYKVQDVFPIATDDWSVIAPTDTPTLTLTTCYTKTERLALRAALQKV